IEGIAVAADRVFVGLRGPVLRGWALLLELFLTADDEATLKLDKSRDRYRKYWLDLGGHGIRDLCFAGSDLLILAGPTLDIDGLAHLYRLPAALRGLEGHWFTPEPLLELLDQYRSQKAEGMTLVADDSQLMVVYDAPDPGRIQDTSVLADIFALPD
ncbi:DUF3616 domain-containing protein, partial [filamentous cyanobacterium CCP5]